MSKTLRLFSWLLFVLPAHTALHNITIDDTAPDPLTGTSIVYDPDGAWNSGADCVLCTAHLSKSQVFNGTWHDSTFNVQPGSNPFPNTLLSATATFTGTAVYVVCALALTATSPSGNSDMSFFLDGDLVDTFSKPAPGTSGYDYNVTVYSNTSIPPGFHTLRIQNGHINGPKSIILLDRIIYITDIEEKQTSSSVGIIAGSVVGAVLGVTALAAAAFFLFCYRRGLNRTSLRLSTRDVLGLNHRDPSSNIIVNPFHDYKPYQPNARYAIASSTKAERSYVRSPPTSGQSGSSHSAVQRWLSFSI